MLLLLSYFSLILGIAHEDLGLPFSFQSRAISIGATAARASSPPVYDPARQSKTFVKLEKHFGHHGGPIPQADT